MQKIETNKEEIVKTGTQGKRKYSTLKVENLTVEMGKIFRRFARFDGHVDHLKQDLTQAREALGQIEQDVEKLDRLVSSL